MYDVHIFHTLIFHTQDSDTRMRTRFSQNIPSIRLTLIKHVRLRLYTDIYKKKNEDVN